MPMNFTENECAEFRGLYDEECGKLVDGVEALIVQGDIQSKLNATQAVYLSVLESRWATDNDTWAIHTLLWSSRASRVASIMQRPKCNDTCASFPFSYYAKIAMLADCLDKLEELPCYQQLE